jgi:succinate dehydrogenase / fumarate reductase membrane anchor subunit
MKSFTHHYVLQRITACLLLALVPWFLWNLFNLRDVEYQVIVKNFGNPYSAALLFVMLISGFYHGYLGIQTICLDYLPNPKMRTVISFMVGTMFIFLSVLGTFCLIRLNTLGH